MLIAHIDSKSGDVESILFLLRLDPKSFDVKILEKICRQGLELSLERNESLLLEFYFRGKLLLLSGNKERARNFFLAIREFSSGGDFIDRTVNELSERELKSI